MTTDGKGLLHENYKLIDFNKYYSALHPKEYLLR